MDSRLYHCTNADVMCITLPQTLSLISALIYLQFLRGLAQVYSLLCDIHPAWSPFRHARRRVEDRIVGICLCIAPTSACRSVLAARESYEARMGVPQRVVSGSYVTQSENPAGFARPARLPLCYPEEQHAVPNSNANVYRVDGVSFPPKNVHVHSSPASPVTKIMRKAVVSARANFPAVSAQQQQAPAQPAPQQQDEYQETQSPAMNNQTQLDTLPQSILQSSTGSPLEHCHTDPGPVLSSSQEPDGISAKRLKRGSKYRSSESFPGRFPVSDGLAYSSLATADYAFRGRGATSVRPFSDV